MKIPYKIIPGSQPVGMAKSLASAAVILSLTACGADTLDSLEASLANGEDVNISISPEDDGSFVIGINDDDAAGPVDSGALFDEATDGEISGCLLYTSPSPRDKRQSRMPSSA